MDASRIEQEIESALGELEDEVEITFEDVIADKIFNDGEIPMDEEEEFAVTDDGEDFVVEF
jgi:hypothetical protein